MTVASEPLARVAFYALLSRDQLLDLMLDEPDRRLDAMQELEQRAYYEPTNEDTNGRA
jgi:hypothetical protein